MNCTFCKIADNGQDAFIVFQNDKCVSFLDIRPLFFGHCLLITKEHFETFYDIPDALMGDIFNYAKKIGKAIEKSMQAQGSFIAINNTVSQSVPHFHMHIIPRNQGDGLKGFFWPRQVYESELQKKTIQDEIIKFLG